MKQNSILIEKLVRDKVADLQLEFHPEDWSSMNSLLDENLPETPKKSNFKNAAFWGVALLIIFMFAFQQWNKYEMPLKVDTFEKRNVVIPERILEVKENEADASLQHSKAEMHKIPISKTTPIEKVEVVTPIKVAEPIKESKIKVVEKQNVSKPPEKELKKNQYPENDAYDHAPQFFGVPTDSIIYDNVKKLKKKRI